MQAAQDRASPQAHGFSRIPYHYELARISKMLVGASRAAFRERARP